MSETTALHLVSSPILSIRYSKRLMTMLFFGNLALYAMYTIFPKFSVCRILASFIRPSNLQVLGLNLGSATFNY